MSFISSIFDMGYRTDLMCTRCGEKFPAETSYGPCVNCGGQLLLSRDLDEISGRLSKSTFKERGWGVWRYRELLPNIDEEKIVSLGEGGTALLKCDKLARILGLRKLFVKDETTNPTGSFLDRGMTVDVSRAKELGFRSLRCRAELGNFAASASAYAARGGFNCMIHSPRERIEAVNLGKLYQIITYGGNLVVETSRVDRKPNETSGQCYLLSPINPYFAEGEKTAAYEICEQLEWRGPDRIVVPMGHGEHLSMIWMGINELRQLGVIKDQNVAMTGVQLQSYARIVDQLRGRKSDQKSLERRKTVSTELAMKEPTHGYLAIRSIEESRGAGVKVKDAEVLDAMALLAKTEGVFAEPAAASTVAGLRKLIEQGRVDRSEEVVCVVTGAGLKDPSTARRFIGKVRAIDRIVSQVEAHRFTTRLGRTKIEILKTISDKETYGYEMWRMLKQGSGLELDISSIYQHLSELENVGLIKRTKAESVLGRPERYYYHLTDRGKAMVRSASAED